MARPHLEDREAVQFELDADGYEEEGRTKRWAITTLFDERRPPPVAVKEEGAELKN